MSTTNRYVRRSKISEAKFRELVRYFALDLDAHKIAALTRLNRNTVNRYLLRIRERIAEHCEEASPVEGIGAGGNGDSSARGRTPVIGIFQSGDSIYTGFVLEGNGNPQPESGRGLQEALARLILFRIPKSYRRAIDSGLFRFHGHTAQLD